MFQVTVPTLHFFPSLFGIFASILSNHCLSSQINSLVLLIKTELSCYGLNAPLLTSDLFSSVGLLFAVLAIKGLCLQAFHRLFSSVEVRVLL